MKLRNIVCIVTLCHLENAIVKFIIYPTFETTGVQCVGKCKKAAGAFPFPVWTDVLYMAAARLVS